MNKGGKSNMSVVKWLGETDKGDIALVGGKGNSLVVLINGGFHVPRGFVVVSDSFFRFLTHNGLAQTVEKLVDEIDRENFADKSDELRKSVLQGEIPTDIVTEVEDALGKLKVQRVAVRSSAVSEDSSKTSFAGLHDTYLNIKSEPGPVLDHVKKCWASLFTERALAYRLKKGSPRLEGMAVIIQEMIPAEVSGVAFTVHPFNRTALLIEVAYGMGDSIVGGTVEPDSFSIDRESLVVLEKRIGSKAKKSICQDEGVQLVETETELARTQAITDRDVEIVASICLKIEDIWHFPQDIEWCSQNKKVWVLQARPITGGEK